MVEGQEWAKKIEPSQEDWGPDKVNEESTLGTLNPNCPPGAAKLKEGWTVGGHGVPKAEAPGLVLGQGFGQDLLDGALGKCLEAS